MPSFIDEIYWLSLTALSCCKLNERFLGCLDISVLSCVLLYTVLLLPASVTVFLWKNSLNFKSLQNWNKSFIYLSLLYPSVLGRKLKLFSKTDFSDSESCFSNMLNIIESSKNVGSLLGFFINGWASFMSSQCSVGI